jgi:predicted O-methyltransferase YrrM
VPEEIKGLIDFALSPSGRSSGVGAFNGQKRREEIFVALLRLSGARTVVETETYLGETTAYLSYEVPRVVTIEASRRWYTYARLRLRGLRNVTILLGDSRARLVGMLDGVAAGRLDTPIMFYLDAHWHADLPLAEELDIIFSRLPDALVILDDFQVPEDPGYGFDDYGLTRH